MTEHLRPCPFCGGADLTAERPASNPVGCDNCGLYVATPEDWNERALGPALDVVLEAVERRGGKDRADLDALVYLRALCYGRGYVTPQDFGAIGDGTTDDSQALRNAEKATDTPSNPEVDK